MKDIPWQVRLRVVSTTINYLCGGSIMNSIQIITAAHCVTDDYGNFLNIYYIEVTAGDVSRSDLYETYEQVAYVSTLRHLIIS